MKLLMTNIVESTHGLTDTVGEPRVMSTIAEPQLRIAAIVALQIATGETIWPGDRRIVIQRPKVARGIFQDAE